MHGPCGACPGSDTLGGPRPVRHLDARESPTKLSTALNYTGDPKEAARRAADLESAGIDMIWMAELYSFDAVSILGYLAAQTRSAELASGILPITRVRRRSRP